jgi:hypothetical protein
MAFDKTQPYATVNTDAGNIYYLQGGVFYQSWNLAAVSSPPAPVDAPNLSAGLATSVVPNNSVIGFQDANHALTIPDARFEGVKLRKRNLGKLRNGVMTTPSLASGQFISYLEEFTIPADCTAIRVHVANAHPTACPQIRCNIGFSEVSGDPTLALNTLTVGGVASSTAGAWSTLSKNGATAIGLIPMVGATVNNPFYTSFDYFPLSSLPRTDAGRTNRVVKLILEFGGFENGVATATTITTQSADVNITTWEQDTDLTSPPYGRFYRTRSQAVAAGVDPTLLTSTTADNTAGNTHAPVIIEYVLKSGYGQQYILLGDSEVEGTKDIPDKYGYLQRALHKLSTAALPIEIINAAQAGTSTANWASMAAVILPMFPNSIVIVPNFSPNTPAPIVNQVELTTIVNAGTGGTPGAVTLTGTTGTGTPFQVAGVISAAGTLTSTGNVTTVGNYTVLPTDITNEPVTGGGLTGCTLALTMTGATLTLAQRDIASIRRIAQQNNCAVITLTCMPSNTGGKDYLGGDPIRVALIAALQASNELYMDPSAFMSSTKTGSQVQMNPLYTTDGLHANPTGHAALEANVATPYLINLTGY